MEFSHIFCQLVLVSPKDPLCYILFTNDPGDCPWQSIHVHFSNLITDCEECGGLCCFADDSEVSYWFFGGEGKQKVAWIRKVIILFQRPTKHKYNKSLFHSNMEGFPKWVCLYPVSHYGPGCRISMYVCMLYVCMLIKMWSIIIHMINIHKYRYKYQLTLYHFVFSHIDLIFFECMV